MLSLIRCLAIYPLDSVIHPLYKWALTIKTEANLTELKSKLIGYRLESVIYLRQFIHWNYSKPSFFRFIGLKKMVCRVITDLPHTLLWDVAEFRVGEKGLLSGRRLFIRAIWLSMVEG